MSRLDSSIRRLEAQRACLNWASAALTGKPGQVLEIGLGNGRTYDHLRSLEPDRSIFVIERTPNPHAACMPDPDHLWIGNLDEVLSARADEFTEAFALVHSDIGTGDPRHGQAMARHLSRLLPPLLANGGLVVSDQSLAHSDLRSIEPPDGIDRDRYFIFQRG